MALEPKDAFNALPPSLAADLIDAFQLVVKNYAEHRWEPSELNGGKLCEAAYTILTGYFAGTYEQRAHKPKDMVTACRNLEKEQGPRSARIQIPRMVVALYEIRNNRGVGHAGGDVDPNHMDATAVVYMSKWVVAELVRLLHGLTTDEATDLVDALVEREVALVWRNGDKRRVLATGLSLRKGTLLLLSGVTEARESDLASWLEQKRAADYRNKVLKPMHKERLIEYDQAAGTVALLPPGVAAAEALIRELGER
ncbi:hypothetical protein BB737_03855 [Mycobacterium avium subsp. hominissuis]|uniref:hypothetical protein n=1 Tax=Mycobacterium avium TaxID=1764 RepID=UPI00039234F2|nr:hypothetical protein [Mycobacterium avium]ETA97681.1 hypothetical protein O982_12060 [Mycobacterium avium 10-5581]ATO63388.1 hypothetical protein BEP52_14620 [Mycobacterium avium subsp. hominissuis]ATO67925.1 hypothetical protein BJP78_14400 [Mycobacterium avium subsp. hominissuis]ATO71934.1 hypothetical protein BJP74_11225 [Mycobacterium avium subsp. hominissuis]PBJ38900.1 hypothetical protein BI294_08480 [Mycobacterium avium subsp. hominissuis]